MDTIDRMIDSLMGSLEEAFKSSIVRKIVSAQQAKSLLKNLSAVIGPVQWDNVEDTDFVVVPATGRLDPDTIYFWLTTAEKTIPFRTNKWAGSAIPANTLLAVSKGSTLLTAPKLGYRHTPSKLGRVGYSPEEGYGSVKRIRELADLAYAIPEAKLKGERSAAEIRKTRAAARVGATAFMKDLQFRDINRARWHTLLQKKHAGDDVVQVMKQIIDTANAIQAEELTRIGGKGKLRTWRRGWSTLVRSAQRAVEEAWEKVETIARYESDFERSKERSLPSDPGRDYMDEYATRSIAQAKLELNGILKTLKEMAEVKDEPDLESPAAEAPAPEPAKEVESLQIAVRKFEVVEAEPRRGDKPLKTHAELADRFLEVRKAIDDLSQQANAVRAIIAQKEQVSAQMAQDLLGYAEEYKDRQFKTKRILVQLEDILPHKAAVPEWKKVINFMLGKLEAISQDLKKEAEAFIDGAKREIPGSTELRYKELESVTSTVAESWIIFRKMFDKVKEWAGLSRSKINDLQGQVSELISSDDPSAVSV